MASIQIHTQDPISPAKANDVKIQAGRDERPSQVPAKTTAAVTYASARPGPTVPTPTSPVTVRSGPPAPQPGAFPVSKSPMTTAKPSLPPPPKAGERPQPSREYTPGPTMPAQAQAQPIASQSSQLSSTSGPNGFPPQSLTLDTSSSPAYPTSSSPAGMPQSTEMSARASLEHPPGYHQNPYASDLTPDQRFATELQEKENRSDGLPSLGYNDNARRRANSIVDDDESVWDAAKKWGTEGMKWGREGGKYLGELHEQVWESIGRK